MFNTPVLDFTISIVFVFFLFSLFAAALLEVVNTVKKRRGRILRDALDKVLNDPQNKNYAELLYNHPIIAATRKDAQSLPSYISAENFSTAIVDVIADESRTIKIGMNADGIAQEIIKNDLPAGSMTEKFRAGLDTLKISTLKNLLISLSQFAETPEQLEQKLITWYNGYMQRVSGWFKRKSQRILMVLSAVVVIAFYVDFFHLAKEFWSNDDLRNRMVESAVETVDKMQRPEDGTELKNLEGEEIKTPEELKADIKERYEAAKEVHDSIVAQNLPVGYGVAAERWRWDPDNGVFKNIGAYILNIIGLIISVLAISRGAPFWFDTLNKLVNLRNSGAKPKADK